MTFDLRKFLVENKMTTTSRLDNKAKKLIKENYIDLKPINSLREEEDDTEESDEESMKRYTRKDMPDSSLDVTDPEDLVSKLSKKDLEDTSLEDLLGGERSGEDLPSLERELKALFNQYGGKGAAKDNPEYLVKAKELTKKIKAIRAAQETGEEEDLNEIDTATIDALTSAAAIVGPVAIAFKTMMSSIKNSIRKHQPELSGKELDNAALAVLKRTTDSSTGAGMGAANK